MKTYSVILTCAKCSRDAHFTSAKNSAYLKRPSTSSKLGPRLASWCIYSRDTAAVATL